MLKSGFLLFFSSMVAAWNKGGSYSATSAKQLAKLKILEHSLLENFDRATPPSTPLLCPIGVVPKRNSRFGHSPTHPIKEWKRSIDLIAVISTRKAKSCGSLLQCAPLWPTAELNMFLCWVVVSFECIVRFVYSYFGEYHESSIHKSDKTHTYKHF